MSTLNLITIITLLTGAVWTVPILVRRRFRDPMRLHLCFALLLMGLGNLLSHPSILHVVDETTFIGFSKITYNVMVIIGLCLMVSFLRQFPIQGLKPPWPWEVTACVLCLAGMILATASLPAELRNHSLTNDYLFDWRVRIFYNLGNFYLLFSYAACAALAGRRIGTGRALRRISLTLISCGLTGLAATCIFRFLWVNLPALRAPGQPVTYTHVFIFGQVSAIVVCVGVSLPWLVSVVHLIQERLTCSVQYRQLGPLWVVLMDAYPELVLNDGRKNENTWRANSSDLYRRYVECRDGLTRLSPYIGSLASIKISNGWRPTPPDAACLIVDALRIATDSLSESTLPEEPFFVFAPSVDLGEDDYEADLNALIEISQELNQNTHIGDRDPMKISH